MQIIEQESNYVERVPNLQDPFDSIKSQYKSRQVQGCSSVKFTYNVDKSSSKSEVKS